jgi:hypothetical protein
VELVLLHYAGWNGFDRDAHVLVAIHWRVEVEILDVDRYEFGVLVDTTLFKMHLAVTMSAVRGLTLPL